MAKGREGALQHFIVSTDVNTQSSATRRLIRSHAAIASSHQSTATRASNRKAMSLPTRPVPKLGCSDSSSGSSSDSQPKQDSQQVKPKAIVNQDPATFDLLSITPWVGLQALPIASRPVFRLPCLPVVVNNYLEKLAVPFPEIDGDRGSEGLLAKSWFPMILHSPAAFEVTMLFSASHLASSLDGELDRSSLLELKHLASNSLCSLVSMGRVDDETISAAAKMACYEAIFGSAKIYCMHMTAVANMISLRGGIEKLGLAGLLARLILFIDTNSAYLLHTHLHIEDNKLPRREPFAFINQARFSGSPDP